VLGRKVQDGILDACLQRELALAKAADAVVCSSLPDLESMQSHGVENVHVVAHRVNPVDTITSFSDREAFLFVGSMDGLDSPDADAMLYFCKQAWPLLQRRTGASLIIAGEGTDAIRDSFSDFGARVLGPQEDRGPLYSEARVFVVPARYSKGAPFEAHEAAAHGVPLVVSSLVGQQLGWQNGEECLVADDAYAFAESCLRLYEDAELWERIRSAALERVRRDAGENTFGSAVERVLESLDAIRQ
jgi:glycosyltransferase involved in cell wall biosynthesis